MSCIYFFIAMQEISTFTFRGNLDTSTVSLAGGIKFSKLFPYSALTSAKFPMSLRKIDVLTSLGLGA